VNDVLVDDISWSSFDFHRRQLYADDLVLS